MKKIDKRTLEAISNLILIGGAVRASEWTSGMGRHTKRRPTPPFCEEITRNQAVNYPKRIQKMFENNRIQSVIAIVDMRGAKKATNN